MSQFFYIHPDNPQQRLINQAVEIVRKGGVIQLIPAMRSAVKLKIKTRWSVFVVFASCRTVTTLP